MEKFIVNFLIVSCLYWAFSAVALASDQDHAVSAAKEILISIQQNKFEKLWDTKVSQYFKSKITKDSFLANLTLGRQQLGEVKETKFIDMAYSQTDPSTGYTGEIYAINFLTTYSAGKFYERIVVVKEQDGNFRLSGLWGAPSPKENE
jgi:Protein of unknown function (DUF4019)